MQCQNSVTKWWYYDLCGTCRTIHQFQVCARFLKILYHLLLNKTANHNFIRFRPFFQIFWIFSSIIFVHEDNDFDLSFKCLMTWWSRSGNYVMLKNLCGADIGSLESVIKFWGSMNNTDVLCLLVLLQCFIQKPGNSRKDKSTYPVRLFLAGSHVELHKPRQ